MRFTQCTPLGPQSCRRVVRGYSSKEGLSSAVDLGIALQLTNILRDIGEDVAQGRIYLPAEEMAALATRWRSCAPGRSHRPLLQLGAYTRKSSTFK